MIKKLVQGFLGLVQKPATKWNYDERRKLTRMRCHYKCQLELEHKKVDAVIRDMGVGGLCLKTFHPLKPGQQLLVLSPFNEIGGNDQPVRCEVIWVHQQENSYASFVGLRYNSDPKAMAKTWVKNVLKRLGFSPESILSKRRWVRADCSVPGSLQKQGLEQRDIRIQNLGIGGILFEYRGILALGEETVRVGPLEGLPALDLQGRLVKARPQGQSFLYGLEFDRLKPAQLRLLTTYLKKFLIKAWES